MKVMPNQIIAHRTPADAWRWACSIVNTYGDKVITEDRKVTKEVRNLMVQILEPGESWPIPGSNWDLPGLEKYAEQFQSGENPTGFAYTYDQRFFRCPDTMTDLCNIEKQRAANYTNQIQGNGQRGLR